MADIISGSVELIQSSTDSKITDASGLSTGTKSQVFFQRYQLYYAETLFPFVNLKLGSGFDKSISETKDPSGETRSTDTVVYPSAALTLNNPFVSAGAGYNVREEKTESSGASSVATIQESKNAFLGFRPEGLPHLDMQFTRTHNYDTAHSFTDVQNDLFSTSIRFSPVKNLDLAYIVTSNDSNDHLSGVDAVMVTQNGRASYSNQFFENRVGLSANYNGFRSTTETRSGSGDVNFQLFPFSGLSDISDIPTLDILITNQALIDGNLTASSGINIGQGVSFGGDTRLRSVGLDFVTITSVNTLYVYVDRQLSAPVADTVAWDVYVSSDNQNWVPFQTGLHGAFNPFTNRFELLFPDVATRYIKVATRPLSVTVLPTPGTDISNVFITELQSFTRKPSSQVVGKVQSTGQFYDVNLHTAITKDRSLAYNVYYSEATSNNASATTFLSNALSYNKQFSPTYSGAARIERDDSVDATSVGTTSYLASASLMAAFLPTLTNSVVLSVGRNESQGQISGSESLFLYNSASLYRGVDINLSGGMNFSKPATGARSRNTLINAGASIVPNKYLSFSVNHSETESTTTANGVNRSASTLANVAWSPFATLYLAYSITDTAATNSQSQTTQNYSASWSPFSNGSLTFTSSYTENRQSQGTTGVDRAFSTGIQWRVGPRIQLSSGYTVLSSRSLSQSVDATSFSTDLRMSF